MSYTDKLNEIYEYINNKPENERMNALKNQIKICRNKKSEHFYKFKEYEKLVYHLQKNIEDRCPEHKWILLKGYDYHSTTFECGHCGKIR